MRHLWPDSPSGWKIAWLGTMALPKKPRRSPVEGELPFEYDFDHPAEEVVTADAGAPLFVRAVRSLGIAGSVKRHPHFKQRQRGFDEATYVESFLVLNALGGECLEDFERLRGDAGLAEMLGHESPSPEAVRKLLYAFHDEEHIERGQGELPVGQVSYIPGESGPLRALAQVNQELVHEIGRRTADQKIATADLDATVIESFKREAKPTYEGDKGYQPLLAVWAEMDLALADEFRDGNVPVQVEPLPATERAFATLPGRVREFYFRGDSAYWDRELVNWLRDERRQDGPQGLITFGISMRMTPNPKKHIVRLSGNLWKPCREDAVAVSECADLLHDVLKNELAAGAMPCGRFGANAVWLRMALLTHNVLTGLKRVALKPGWLEARPKRLRCHFFFSPGKLIHHARRLVARVGRRALELLEWAEAWRLLPATG